MVKKQRLVVIGNGMAGQRLVEEVLTRTGATMFDIVVFGDEPCGSYSRIRLSGVLAGTENPADIFVNPMAWHEQRGITLHCGVRAGSIDRMARKVYTPGGLAEPYDMLVLATGSTPIVPPIQGLHDKSGGLRPGVFTFRTLADCTGMQNHISAGRKAAVIGGGILGLETAAGLVNRGMEVHLVHAAPFLIETSRDPVAGAMIKESLEAMGIKMHLEQAARTVMGNGQVAAVAIDDGSILECDLVVVTTGTRPNVDLAKQAALSVHRGIVINDDLSCRNDPSIFAIGDCAEHDEKVYGTVAPAWEQARVLAKRLAGNDKALYHGSLVSTALKIDSVQLALMGSTTPLPGDEVVSYHEPSRGTYQKLVIRGGRLAGAILLGDDEAAARALYLFHNQHSLPENRVNILFPANGPPSTSLAHLPAEACVCRCNGVSKSEIMAAVKKGCRTYKSISEVTGAGTGCGSCKSQVQAIMELASDGPIEKDPTDHYYVPGVPLTKPQLIKAIKEQNLRRVSEVFNALASGREDAGSKAGLASLLRTIWGQGYQDERDARFINDRVHANIQKDGTFSVVPRIYGGITTPDALRRLADVAEQYKVPLMKLTGGQRIALLGVPKENLPWLWRDLGMPSGYAYSRAFRTCKTCVGTDFCRYGLDDSAALGMKIENRFQGIETPHKIKLAVSGCPRNCAEATTKDLGAVAIGNNNWEVYTGGAAGGRVRSGDVLCVATSHDQVLKYMGRFIAYYCEHAKYQERTYDFVPRLGMERLRRLLVEDSEGLCSQLDDDIQSAVAAYRDPWEEARQPLHPAQFVTTIGLVKA